MKKSVIVGIVIGVIVIALVGWFVFGRNNLPINVNNSSNSQNQDSEGQEETNNKPNLKKIGLKKNKSVYLKEVFIMTGNVILMNLLWIIKSIVKIWGWNL